MDVYAVHHVRIGRGVYTPGEYIDASIPADQLERLLRLGAVRTAGESRDQGLPPQKDAEPIWERGEPEEEADATEAQEDAEEDTEADEAAEAEAEDEADLEADFEPPTIDASDGLVSAKKTGAKAGKGGKKA